jgi:hypothetical protein
MNIIVFGPPWRWSQQVLIYQTTRHHIPEDNTVNILSCEKLDIT